MAMLFLARMAAWAGALYLLFFPFEGALQQLEMDIVRAVLRVLGTHTQALSVPFQFLAENYRIEISPLCSGLPEMALLGGAILATREHSIRARIHGAIVFLVILFSANILRIVASVQQLIHTSLSFAEFTHGILFRGVLILGFALLYALWLRVAAREEK